MPGQFSDVVTVILAAGRGTRMKSDKAKVLHEINGRPMLGYILDTAQKLAGDNIILVIGHQAEAVRQWVTPRYLLTTALQERPQGTAHAVMCAMPRIGAHVQNVLILYGDVPLLRQQTLTGMLHRHQSCGDDITLLAITKDDPAGYGRLIFDSNGRITDIVEEADADPMQKKLNTVNSGVYCIKHRVLEALLPCVGADNRQKEYYLTDIVRLGVEAGMRIGHVLLEDAEEVSGINCPDDLLRAENYYSKLPQQTS